MSSQEREETMRDFIKLMQKTKEFRELSDISIRQQLFQDCQLVELQQTETVQIEDEDKLDFWYLLKGECSLVFEVRRIIDNRENANVYKELTQEEVEAKKDIASV